MYFALSEEQEVFQSFLRKYTNSIEGTRTARKYSEGNAESIQEAWSGLAELGVMAINVPEEYDGAELGQLDLSLALQEAGRSLLPGPYVETMGFAVPIIKKYGTDQQKKELLPAIAAGQKTVSLAWMEPELFSYDLSDIRAYATTEEDGYRINGQKTFVAYGDSVDALIVPVKITGGDQVALFLVDSNSADLTSELMTQMDKTAGMTEIILDNVYVGRDRMIGKAEEGTDIFEYGLLYLNASLASTMVGGMQKILDMAVEYAKTREQFGQPIGRFQAIKHKLADMKVDVDTALSLTYYANWALDTDAEDKQSAVASARAFATEAFIRAASDNIQIHGGIGFTQEIDCHMYLKRARLLENYAGYCEDYYEKISEGLGW